MRASVLHPTCTSTSYSHKLTAAGTETPAAGRHRHRHRHRHGLGCRRRHRNNIATAVSCLAKKNKNHDKEVWAIRSSSTPSPSIYRGGNKPRGASETSEGSEVVGNTRDATHGAESEVLLQESDSRLQYLEALVTLRSLYRSFLRAQYWIKQPQPMTQSHPSKGRKGKAFKSKSKGKQEEDIEVDEEEELAFALDAVAEMALTSDQLSGQLQKLPSGYGSVLEALFKSSSSHASSSSVEAPSSLSLFSETTTTPVVPPVAPLKENNKKMMLSMESKISRYGRALSQELADRLESELVSLPFKSKREAWSAVRQLITNEAEDFEESEDSNNGNNNSSNRSILQGERGKSAFRRVRKAEKAAEKLVERVRASSKGMMMRQGEGEGINFNATANYAKDVWIRLNGGGKSGLDFVPIPEDLPTPGDLSERANAVFQMGKPSAMLSIGVEKLDKELKEASKVRESKLRKAGVLERARMDSDLKDAENKVTDLRQQLALKTLQLEMRLVFEYLEKEALQIIDENQNFLPWRRGSSEELALLVAEYALLDRKTTSLIGFSSSSDSSSSGSGGKTRVVIGKDYEDLLSELATDVPDLRMRLGITDNEVVMMSLDTRIKNVVLIVEDSGQKVRDSFVFMGTGVKLLVTDVTQCGKLFGRALVGGTLQPREVETLRRTARDLLTFVPFIIILILPITPVGHVLVFSFIQQNFPALFPSQFTSARQQSMQRYETLKRQLDETVEQEGLKWREEQFNRALEAVEALTTNVTDGQVDSVTSLERERELESTLMDDTAHDPAQSQENNKETSKT